MSDNFLNSLDDISEEQESLLEMELDPDMALLTDFVDGNMPEPQAAEVRARLQKDPNFRDLAAPLLLARQHGPRPHPLPRAELERKWLELRRRIGLPELTDGPVVDPAMDAFRAKISEHKRGEERRRWYFLAAVLVFTIVPIAGTQLYRLRDRGSQHTSATTSSVFELGDGSRVTLKPNSEIKYSREFLNRGVKLTGEADFDVVRTSTPFSVRTGSAIITVTGTHFTVHAYAGEPTIVSVTLGTVQIAALNEAGDLTSKTLTLTAGQRARIVLGATPEIIP
jgi:ferric-dicitrate binding protein FerR (iron transport regulator)